MPTAAQFAAILTRQEPALPRALRDGLAAYLALVGQYNRVLGLTSFRDPDVLTGELVGEALRLMCLAPLADGAAVADLGSGNGCPVLPLALALPQVRFTAVESGARRAAFLRQAAALLKLDNLAVAEARVEEWARTAAGSLDCITSRAFAPPAKLLPLCLKLLARPGEVRGYAGADPAELTAAAAAHGLRVRQLEEYAVMGAVRHAYRLVLD